MKKGASKTVTRKNSRVTGKEAKAQESERYAEKGKPSQEVASEPTVEENQQQSQSEGEETPPLPSSPSRVTFGNNTTTTFGGEEEAEHQRRQEEQDGLLAHTARDLQGQVDQMRLLLASQFNRLSNANTSSVALLKRTSTLTGDSKKAIRMMPIDKSISPKQRHNQQQRQQQQQASGSSNSSNTLARRMSVSLQDALTLQRSTNSNTINTKYDSSSNRRHEKRGEEDEDEDEDEEEQGDEHGYFMPSQIGSLSPVSASDMISEHRERQQQHQEEEEREAIDRQQQQDEKTLEKRRQSLLTHSPPSQVRKHTLVDYDRRMRDALAAIKTRCRNGELVNEFRAKEVELANLLVEKRALEHAHSHLKGQAMHALSQEERIHHMTREHAREATVWRQRLKEAQHELADLERAETGNHAKILDYTARLQQYRQKRPTDEIKARKELDEVNGRVKQLEQRLDLGAKNYQFEVESRKHRIALLEQDIKLFDPVEYLARREVELKMREESARSSSMSEKKNKEDGGGEDNFQPAAAFLAKGRHTTTTATTTSVRKKSLSSLRSPTGKSANIADEEKRGAARNMMDAFLSGGPSKTVKEKEKPPVEEGKEEEVENRKPQQPENKDVIEPPQGAPSNDAVEPPHQGTPLNDAVEPPQGNN